MLINAFYGKTMESVGNRIRLDLFKKDDTKNTIKQQSKLTFNRNDNSYGNCESYKFKQNDFFMDKLIYL